MHSFREKSSGFTLMELIVVVAIVGILAAIAIPSYTSYVLRNNRAMVRQVLTDLAARQEAESLKTRSYALTFTPLVGGGTTEIWLEQGGTIRFAATTRSVYRVYLDPTPTATSYTLKADALNTQTRDTDCLAFTLASNGVRTPDSGDCWDR